MSITTWTIQLACDSKCTIGSISIQLYHKHHNTTIISIHRCELTSLLHNNTIPFPFYIESNPNFYSHRKNHYTYNKRRSCFLISEFWIWIAFLWVDNVDLILVLTLIWLVSKLFYKWRLLSVFSRQHGGSVSNFLCEFRLES